MTNSVIVTPAVTTVTVTNPNAITVEIPQGLGPSNSPTFAGLTTGTATVSGALTVGTAAVTGDLTTGTATITGSATVAGGAAVTGGLTASQNIEIVTTSSGAVYASTFAAFHSKKVIYTGSGVTMLVPAPVAADVGKSWTFINAGTGGMVLTRTDTDMLIKNLDGSTVTAGTSNLTIAVGGVTEIICIAVDTYVIFGSGIS